MKVFTRFQKLESETQQQYRSWEKHQLHKPLTCLFVLVLHLLDDCPPVEKSQSSEAAGFFWQGGHSSTCWRCHFSTHAHVFLLGWGRRALDKVRERVNAVLTGEKCLSNPTVVCCAESVLHVIHSLCALICATVAFHLHCWLRVISHWWLLNIRFLCAFHSSKACPKLYSNAFSGKCVPFSPSVARMRSKKIPLLVALPSAAEMNTKV